MKLILTEHADHVEVEVMDGSLRLHCYTLPYRGACQGVKQPLQAPQRGVGSALLDTPF